MGVGDLAVAEGDVVLDEVLDHVCEGCFAGIGGVGEHAFAKEGVADLDAVEAADELVVLPCLVGVCEAMVVECAVGGLHFWGDPCAVLSVAWGGAAGLDDLGEGGVFC